MEEENSSNLGSIVDSALVAGLVGALAISSIAYYFGHKTGLEQGRSERAPINSTHFRFYDKGRAEGYAAGSRDGRYLGRYEGMRMTREFLNHAKE